MKKRKETRIRGALARNKVIQFKVNEGVLEALQESAKALEGSVNDAARTLLEEALFPITLQLDLEQIRTQLDDRENSLEKLAEVLVKASKYLDLLKIKGEWYQDKLPVIMGYKSKFIEADTKIRRMLVELDAGEELKNGVDEIYDRVHNL